MNSKIKFMISILILVAFIGTSAILYQKLSPNYDQDQFDQNISGRSDTHTSRTDSSDTENANEKSTDETNDTADEPQEILAPDFSVIDGDGNTVHLSDFIGKPVVLNFWASWCPPCKSEMPDFDQVFLELGEDITFMMINATDGSRETKEKAENYILDQGFSFPVYYDTTWEAAYTYGAYSLPTTFFIDKDGYLIAKKVGMMSETTLRKYIDQILPDTSDDDQVSEYKRITAEEAKIMMDASEAYILLDVRTKEEYDEKHIDGALLIPDTEIEQRATDELPDTDALILIYCRSGRRSALTATLLLDMGYRNVYDFGGIIDWPYDTLP